jgi:hypothetical protein
MFGEEVFQVRLMLWLLGGQPPQGAYPLNGEDVTQQISLVIIKSSSSDWSS